MSKVNGEEEKKHVMCYPQGRAGNLCKTPSASNLSVDGMPGVTPKLVTAAQKLLESMAFNGTLRTPQTNKQTKQTNKNHAILREKKTLVFKPGQLP